MSADEVVFHSLLNEFATALQFPVGERFGCLVDAKAVLDTGEVKLESTLVHAELFEESFTVPLCEHHGDVCELGDDVEIWCEARDGAV